MKYIALLRGINVGGNHKVEMKTLKRIFESLGFVNVSTYINSGNVIFDSNETQKNIEKKVFSSLKTEFTFEIPTLIKSETEIKQIANALPKQWKNDGNQRTDIAFLFAEIDSKKTIELLPLQKEFIDVRYTKGAIFWNLDKVNRYKSQLAKLVGHKLYQFMTLRNVNTVRYLAQNVSNH
ncbi:DUF1697 domain-containing protein [Candidatus Peregrinibacteria bacterium]|nr:MAG: DUF1697 domain-containing protein [Candidatus Peregrinibacteria bacterium]